MQLEERQRQPSSQEIDIFEQQEISKSWLQVKEKFKEWYDRLVNLIPEPIKEKASRAFKTFKDKIMEFYKRVKGKEPKESFNPIELEQAFDRAYRSYRINGRSRIDVDTFSWIRQNLIDLISNELTDLNSAKDKNDYMD